MRPATRRECPAPPDRDFCVFAELWSEALDEVGRMFSKPSSNGSIS